jgi:acetate kinase
VVAHLGSGASVSAILRGRSIDTSMALTPGGGVMMATRSGDLDPGAVLYLQREQGLDLDELQTLLNERSGLLGVSGISGDLRILRPLALSNPAAKLAIEMFGYAIQKQIAAMISVLGGIDLLVFSGGIGENDAGVRLAATCGLRPFGVRLDAKRNRAGVGPLEAKGGRCEVRVMHCRESLQIALHALRLVAAVDSVPAQAPA